MGPKADCDRCDCVVPFYMASLVSRQRIVKDNARNLAKAGWRARSTRSRPGSTEPTPISGWRLRLARPATPLRVATAITLLAGGRQSRRSWSSGRPRGISSAAMNPRRTLGWRLVLLASVAVLACNGSKAGSPGTGGAGAAANGGSTDAGGAASGSGGAAGSAGGSAGAPVACATKRRGRRLGLFHLDLGRRWRDLHGGRAAEPASGLPSIALLPDPFKKLDGTEMTTKAEWTCRREEIRKQAELYAFGTKLRATDGDGDGDQPPASRST